MMTDPMAPATAAEASASLVREMIVTEIVDFDARFLDASGIPSFRAIFDWLLDVEARHDGVVSLATVGTDGSRWLLARRLGETLCQSVDAIADGTAAFQAVTDMTEVLTFGALVSMWRMNDRTQLDRVLSEVTRRRDEEGEA